MNNTPSCDITKQENEKIKGETKGSYPNRKEKTVVWNCCLGEGES